MSFESNEDRIERLEKSFGVIMDKVLPSLGEIRLEMSQLVVLIREEINAILRFICSQDVFGSKESRQELLDAVSRRESQLDALMKHISDALARAEKFKHNQPPPPDHPGE